MSIAAASPPLAAPAPSRWPAVVGLLGGVVLGLVLLVAAWSKALDPLAFAEQIRLEKLDGLLPATAVAYLALALEVGLGLALLLNLRRRPVLALAGALVVFFLFLTGRAYWRHLNGTLDPALASCGCFGNLVERTPGEAFWQDVLLLVPPFLLAFLGRPTGPWPRARTAVVVVATLGFLAFAWRAPTLPLDDLATRLRPGVAIEALCAGAEGTPERVCLDAVLPALSQGRHLVVIADLDAPQPESWVAPLDELEAASETPLWVLHGGDPERQRLFFWEQAPTFELHEAPAPLLRPLYRRLPRSFEVVDGVVARTWAGLPPSPGAAAEESTPDP